jgi:hypothetical protein
MLFKLWLGLALTPSVAFHEQQRRDGEGEVGGVKSLPIGRLSHEPPQATA